MQDPIPAFGDVGGCFGRKPCYKLQIQAQSTAGVCSPRGGDWQGAGLGLVWVSLGVSDLPNAAAFGSLTSCFPQEGRKDPICLALCYLGKKGAICMTCFP